jgi:uncharacterized membrane protein
VSLVAASAIAFAALYLAHGFTRQTTVALLGTLSGLLCVAILAIVFMALARITGVGSEDALIVSALTTNIDLGGIVLGGIVIGALGAIDDMTVTQASAIAELRAADPTATHTGLLRSGMRIGRDHVASTVNTLFLAYAGASLPLLILFVLSQQSVGTVVNREVLATEVLRTLVGSFGLVVSVPVTTWLAVRLVDTPPRGRPRGRAASAERAPEAEASDAGTLGPPDELHLPERRRDAFW